MGNISLSQAKGLFYKAYIARFKEIIPAASFLKSFFEVTTTTAKTVGIEVQRGTERIAVDVLRGQDGNRNQFSLSTEKEFLPPFLNENFDATLLDMYDRVFGGNITDVPPAIVGYLANDIAEKYAMLRMKMERYKEKQAAEVFETGIVLLNKGTNIDFKRKAASKVDLGGAGGYWTTTTTDVETQLISGAEFIRQSGKNGTPEFNLVMSGASWVSFKKTNFFTNNATYQKVSLIDINTPQATAFGAAYHGRITAGAYIFNIWTYDEGYENSSGVFTRYMPANITFMTPVRGTRFLFSHAGIPAIIKDTRNAEFPEYIGMQAGEYWTNDYIDPKAKSHTFEIMSAPVPVPVTVDMMYTMQVSA